MGKLSIGNVLFTSYTAVPPGPSIAVYTLLILVSVPEACTIIFDVAVL